MAFFDEKTHVDMRALLMQTGKSVDSEYQGDSENRLLEKCKSIVLNLVNQTSDPEANRDQFEKNLSELNRIVQVE